MNFKIVSSNNELKQKAHHIFTVLGMKESIHIQEVDFWLIDAKSVDKEAIESYKNRQESAFLLFVVNNDEEIKTVLINGFSSYINISFSNDELKSWYVFFTNTKKEHILHFSNNISLDIKTNELIYNKQTHILSKQESTLLRALISGEFISTKLLKNLLGLNSEISVRTIINRIRKKVNKSLFEQKRSYGYRLNVIHKKDQKKVSDAYVKELEEQNALIQEIVDNSSVYVATFIHKQLFCINKSFRELLGTKVVEELWREANGDFFQLIKQSNQIKDSLFDAKSTTHIQMYDFSQDGYHEFNVQTYFFEQLDKHLLIFNSKKK